MNSYGNDTLWQTKLHARLHDPAEKALVLFRDPAGHEGGTSKTLHSLLFSGQPKGDMARHVKRADWWASAADRPQLPRNASWAQLRWTRSPVLLHPLTGQKFDLHSLADTEIGDIKARSLAHFERLIERDCDTGDESADVDWWRTLLAYWRFGPELGNDDENDDGKLGDLWQHLPADTRIPDHTIWDHLDLTSAFAGAFAADSNDACALLALSIGPVQPFIAAARSTSDLWAGSHLLARLSWEAMRVVCERYGPDAILFPRLRGVPQVDLWLRDDCGLDSTLFNGCTWTHRSTDANPLFIAALPNRFVAVVPAEDAHKLGKAIEQRTRSWLQDTGREVVDLLLDAAEISRLDQPRDKSVYAYKQIKDQLNGFPEVHWAAVPFSLVRPRNTDRQTDLDVSRLSDSMAPFFGAVPGERCGFLDSPTWKVLRNEIGSADAGAFYLPNPGVLYPAVYDLAERVLAAAKAVRPFEQCEQNGWRCSLTGESEWLTTDATQLVERSYRGRDDTLWGRIAKKKPAWAKRNEHLGALAAVKRLWPSLFAKEVGRATDEAGTADRFVVSTHTMALAAQIERSLNQGDFVTDELSNLIKRLKPSAVPLPRRLNGDKQDFHTAKKLPELLAVARDSEEGDEQAKVECAIKRALGIKGSIETYYGLLMMDGDRMGRILSGTDPKFQITYQESFHPDIARGFTSFASAHPEIERYLAEKRAVSPNRHLAVSAALNNFALCVVPEVIENEFLGRVLYAGGDDVLAMLPVADLMPAMRRLRYAYCGADPDNTDGHWRDAKHSKGLVCKDGFAMLGGRLMRLMGSGATASCGAVVAHHQAPLATVLRELRSAERLAKDSGRDRFSLKVIKRSGGDLTLTTLWEHVPLLLDVRNFLGESCVSRRAVYHTLTWLRDMPSDAGSEMLSTMLAFQLRRQASDKRIDHKYDLHNLAHRLSEFAQAHNTDHPADGQVARSASGVYSGQRTPWRTLGNFLSVAEFLAREARLPGEDDMSTGPIVSTSANSTEVVPG